MVHHRDHKSPPPVPVMNRMNPIHSIIPSFVMVHFASTKEASSIQVFWLKFCSHFSCHHSCYVSRPSDPPCFDHSNEIWQCSLLRNFLQPHVTSSLLSSNILEDTPFSNSLNLCSSFNVTDRVSHSYKTDKLAYLIYNFSDSTRQHIPS
jgi:hypothetical protein